MIRLISHREHRAFRTSRACTLGFFVFNMQLDQSRNDEVFNMQLDQSRNVEVYNMQLDQSRNDEVFNMQLDQSRNVEVYFFCLNYNTFNMGAFLTYFR